MRTFRTSIIASVIMIGTSVSYGLMTTRTGPDCDREHPTIEQSDWPAGIVALPRHDSRVFSTDTNGSECFYFDASPDEINELIQLFSKTRVRDHEMHIKSGNNSIKLRDTALPYNVSLYLPGAFTRSTYHAPGHSNNDPALTIFVPADVDPAFFEKITLPDNIILHNEVPSCPLKGKATRPERKFWHVRVQFNDGTPAADFENGVATKVTLWQKDNKNGIHLEKVNVRGEYYAAFSDKDIADLKTGKSWLTLTVGNHLTEARSDHPRLSIDKFSLDKAKAQLVKIAKSAPYYGRILFEDGSMPADRSAARIGKQLRVHLPYAGMASVDTEGYFTAFITEEQYAKIKASNATAAIFREDYEQHPQSPRPKFPLSKLTKDKTKAHVVTFPMPGKTP